MPIRILSEQLAAQIAAGEVIERPASVVKELVENSLDAGATEVRVDVRDGGKRLIRVSDNGSGIPGDEVELAFVHHATSKLESSEDLFAIRTLGFRGEALPSIAAVSQVTMLTRAGADEAGSELRLSAGRLLNREPHAAPTGTTLSVENLFFNIPARLKFLKSTTTEMSHIQDLVNRYALAYPAVRFSLQNENRLVFQTTGNDNMQDVLIAVYGLETARQMVRLEPRLATGMSSGATTVDGFVSLPTLTRANRAHMVFFVNGRAVNDRNLNFAVSEAYRTLLQVGRFPTCVILLRLPPDEVDVNVHPTKAEVRFRDAHSVFSIVQRAVRATLVSVQPVPPMGFHEGSRTTDVSATQPEEPVTQWLGISPWQFGLAPTPSPQTETRQGEAVFHAPTASSMPAQEALADPGRLPVLRVLGQVARTYIVAEGPDGIFLIDQHAAHERVLYEQFRRERAETATQAQALLEPLSVELTPRQAARLQEQLELFQSVGFQIEPFGGSTFLMRAVPAMMADGDPRQALAIILDELADEREWGHGRPSGPLDTAREARMAASVCKQAAIRAGRLLSQQEMSELIRRLEATDMPRTCPHGRPTMIRLGLEQLSREFGRA